MSLIAATQLTAVATTVLAFFATVTACFAYAAFRKQSEEVRTLQGQATDQKELTGQQAELLKVQAGQLDLQRQQFEDQRQINAKQAEVMGLQAQELQESLGERKRATESQRRAQASKVFIWAEWIEISIDGTLDVTAHIINSSDQPIYGAEVYWYRGTAGLRYPNPEPLPTIMPGTEVRRTRAFPPHTNIAVSGAALRFRDAAGVKWLRRLDGELTEQQE